MKSILLAMSDPHCGHNLGLMLTDTVIEDHDQEGNLVPYCPRLTDTQKFIENIYLNSLNRIASLSRKYNDCPIHIINLGDICQGEKHKSRWVSNRRSDQMEIAIQAMKPALDLPNLVSFNLLKGTSVHDDGDGSNAIEFITAVAPLYPDIKFATMYHLHAEYDGVVFDAKHKRTGKGTRWWTKGSSMRYYAKSLYAEELENGFKPSNIILGGHYHTFHAERINKGHWFYLVPSLCGIGEYAKANVSDFIQHIGMLAFVLDNGRVTQIDDMVESIDFRTKQVWSGGRLENG